MYQLLAVYLAPLRRDNQIRNQTLLQGQLNCTIALILFISCENGFVFLIITSINSKQKKKRPFLLAVKTICHIIMTKLLLCKFFCEIFVGRKAIIKTAISRKKYFYYNSVHRLNVNCFKINNLPLKSIKWPVASCSEIKKLVFF